MAKELKPGTVLTSQICDALNAHGLWVVRLPVQGVKHGFRTGKSPLKGFPDLMVVGPEGTMAWLEVKYGKDKVSEEQKTVHERLAVNGHTVAVVSSVEQAVAVLFHADMITRSTGH